MMRKRVIVAVVMLSLFVVFVIISRPNDSPIQYDPEGRYDSRVLNDMDVIYKERSDILWFSAGYSVSNNCPWGFAHCGLDIHFMNGSSVVAGAPGKVTRFETRDNGPGSANRYTVIIEISFNWSVVLHYCFEPWTNNTVQQDQQLSMIKVRLGDWVMKGQEIGSFLRIEESAHIHFGVKVNHQWVDPRPFYSTEAYEEMMTLIHTFNPDWEMSYP